VSSAIHGIIYPWDKVMKKIIQNTIWKFGDGISTDHITPGRYYHLRGDIPALAKHALEDGSKNFALNAKPGEIIVAGKNFGQGSSREHAALVIKERGIPVILAKSFARIFFRNAVNVGLIPITYDTSGFETGDEIRVDLDAAQVFNSTSDLKREFAPLPEIMNEILIAGGLVAFVEKNGGLP
jgi:3-isopropylmalate/(R)-2-methylmalate dehydratase small subunit